MITKINKTSSALAIISYCLLAIGLTACSPDDFMGADPDGLPTVSGVDFQISVDQETNQMIASYTPEPGTYPIWILDGTSYSTLQEVGYKNNEAGSHTIELRLGNRNGISQTGIKKEYTFNESKIDYTNDFRRITEKEWRIDYSEVAHMACGPAGTAGTGWWSAQPGEKKDFGVYDDRITFTADRQYTYNPGEGGTVYVNKDVNAFSSFNTNDGNDYMAEVSEQNSTYSFDADGDKILLRLPAQTLFPYISSDAQYNDPVFTVSKLTDTDMTLLYEGDGITWRFMLTTKDPSDGPDEPEAVMDWDYASSSNLWKAVDDGTAFDAFGYYFADDGWSPVAFSEATHSGDTYEITLPEGLGGSQWQGQFHIDTKLTASAEKAYNFYLVMETTNDCPGVTFKLTDSGDSNFFIEERVDVPAGGFVFKREGVTLKEGTDASAIRLFFDFGGSPSGTNVKISKIYLEEAVVLNYDDEDNLWKAVDDGSAFDAFGYYFADDGWSPISYSEVTKTGNAYELTLPEGLGGSQWQGQFHIDTKLTASADKAYNFQFDIESDYDLPGVTMKLTDSGDTNWFTEERHDVASGDVRRFTWKGVKTHEGADASAIRLFFDFGGSPAGAKVKISNIVFKEAQ